MTLQWNDLVEALQLEVFAHLASRYGIEAAGKGLRLTETDINNVKQLAEDYNKQNNAEDEAVLLMQQDQLNAILRTDHATESIVTQPLFENITMRHLWWIRRVTNDHWNVCAQQEVDDAATFLRHKNLDASMLAHWIGPRLAEASSQRERFKIHDIDLVSKTRDSVRIDKQPEEHPESGCVTTESAARNQDPKEVLQNARLRLKVPRPVGRPKGRVSALPASGKRRRRLSPSPLHNALPIPTSNISSRPESAPAFVRTTSVNRPDTPTETSSSPDILSPHPTRSLRARSQLKPSRAALEMEDSGEFFLRHKGVGLENENQSDGDEEALQEIQPKKLIIMKFTDTGRAYLRKVKQGAISSKSAGSKNKNNLGIFTGLSTKLSPMKPHTPRIAPLLPSKQPVRREVIGWNPPKRPSNFPQPTRMNDFTRRLLNLSKQDLGSNTDTAEAALSRAISSRRESVTGPSPAWSPISDQDISGSPPKPPRYIPAGDGRKGLDRDEPSSSPQFAATVNDVLNHPDPSSPLLLRTQALSTLLTPATSPPTRALNRGASAYSPSEASEPADQLSEKKAFPSGRSRAPRDNETFDKATPPPKASTPKRPYKKTSPYWLNRSTYEKPTESDREIPAQSPPCLKDIPDRSPSGQTHIVERTSKAPTAEMNNLPTATPLLRGHSTESKVAVAQAEAVTDSEIAKFDGEAKGGQPQKQEQQRGPRGQYKKKDK